MTTQTNAGGASVQSVVRRPLIGRQWIDEKDRTWLVTDMVRPGIYQIVWRSGKRCRIGEVQARLIREKTEPVIECEWCGERLNGKKFFGNRIHPDELFCSKSHRDESTRQLKAFKQNVKT